MFRLIYFVSLISLMFCGIGSAQEGIPVYFDYLTDNDYLIHPAMAGNGNGGKIRMTGRQQWFDLLEAPNLQTLNIQYRFPNSPNGVGVILFNDANGYHTQSGLKMTYAHHLNFASDARIFKQLSFGLSVTALQSALDETDFRSMMPDPSISGSVISAFYLNVDLGISYAYKEWYGHATILNVLDSERKLYRMNGVNATNPAVIDNLRRYLLSLGYRIDRGSWWLEPSMLFQLSDFSMEKTLDLNAKVYKPLNLATLWVGLSFRGSLDAAVFQTDNGNVSQRLQLVTPMVGANVNRYVFSYNYSYQFGDYIMGNGGYHQITLGMDFGPVREDRFKPKWRNGEF
ncbi:MAG: hypothetical protein RLZZ241_1399 [Bacteroidota bacterium]|jgi:type IX secretion system PorP/SprF family membrane protein